MGGGNPADLQARTCVGLVAQANGWSSQVLHGKKARGRRSRHPGAETVGAEARIRSSVLQGRLPKKSDFLAQAHCTSLATRAWKALKFVCTHSGWWNSKVWLSSGSLCLSVYQFPFSTDFSACLPSEKDSWDFMKRRASKGETKSGPVIPLCSTSSSSSAFNK